MVEQGKHKIDRLRRRYISFQLLADGFFAASLAGLLGCFGYAVFSWSWGWAVLLFFLFFGCLAAVSRWWAVKDKAITNFLNLKYPALEESSDLVLKEPSALNLLERMQLARIGGVLQSVPFAQREFLYRLKLSILLILAVPVFGYEVTWMRDEWKSSGLTVGVANFVGHLAKHSRPEKILPQVRSAEVSIAPPAYTRKPKRAQDKFTIEAEEGSVINWKLELNVPAKKVALIFNDGQQIALKNTGGGTVFNGEKVIDSSGFYQVNIDGRLSDLYQVQAIQDNPPVIHIKTPRQYTYIDAGEVPKVNISVAVDDDYGIGHVFIYATIAKGSGEAVKFKEQKIDFLNLLSGKDRHYDLQKMLSLPALDMEPGDELYFYIQAQDNHRQQSRTDVYIVSLQDTAQLLSMDGLLSGVNVKPEFFRSERQIILDAERLLRERDSISKESFDTRSNDLGTDQKLLRLRYGKFLGEESESDIDPKDEQNDAVADIRNYGNAAVVLDKYADKHDNAEDAQFFDPGVKAQLKATLTEMWKAELQLRLYKPGAALPFAYKALRLLKDLQQKSRAYVAKTAYNPAPLKLEKRLTGELDKIIEPVYQQDIKPVSDQLSALKHAVSILETLRFAPLRNHAAIYTLQLANQQLSGRASAQPGIFLPAVSALRKVIASGRFNPADIGIIEKAIQRILPDKEPVPGASQHTPNGSLSSGYFKNLQNK